LDVIDEVFSEANQYNNYGRKLYLIQNCIYGVDIQPIAVTIAKLRFFISLIIEQESNGNRNANYGIRPLPNLETKLVAANTLIGLKELRQPDLQLLLENDSIQQLRQKIEDIRLKYFSEDNRQDKLDYITDEEKCREQLATALATEHDTWCKQEQNKISAQVKQVPKKQARQQLREKLQKAYRVREAKLTAGVVEAKRIADWDPYDQNDKADFFDPEWMFGITDGFDITIGNPPYVRAEAGNDDPILRQKIIEMRQQIEVSKQYETLFEKWDLFIPFIERSYKLLKPTGFTTLIVSDAYCHTKYSLKSQKWFLEKSKILRLDFCGKVPLFGSVGVRNVIFLFQKTDGSDNKPERRRHVEKFGKVQILPTDEQQNLTHRTFFPEDTAVGEFISPTVVLSNICYISYGLRPSSKKGAKEKFVTADVVSEKQDELHCKPFVEGKHLETWLPLTNLWIEWDSERAPSKFYAPTFPEMYEIDEKILVQRSPGSDPKACYDNQYLIFTPSSVGFILWNDLSGTKNKSIQKHARYRDEKFHPDLPQREELEEISRRFALKFLLGVMNSAVACNFLRANRRSNIHIYPDDWKQLPIPDVPPKQQGPVIALVDKILAAKRKGFEKKVARLEKKLDKEVSKLYGVGDEE
ncbi:MAG: Eco57I restriction-modification methylase domain-containing protein, partial [Candidatus Poribacteria bacterium]|nr:Eco57I restriction-modification methylase domain-containing protein [Candidatus Poribacteria bacterium]